MLQESPFAIQLELVEGCNRGCFFCGIQGIRNNGANGPKEITGKNSFPIKVLTKKKARIIAERIAESGWNPRIEFAMHGEPLLNKNYLKIFKIFRKQLPKLSFQLTTNGIMLLKFPGPKNRIDEIMEAGINVIKLDAYETDEVWRAIYKRIKGLKNWHPITFFPSDKSKPPHARRKPHEHDVVFVRDISEANDKTLEISNHCGCSFPLDHSQANKRCARPFREMSIRWDGKVAICCLDWRGYYKCGSAITTSLEKLWNNKYFNSARIKLYHRQRDFIPCYGCDAKSFRVGFLPDKLGKIDMPEPTKKDLLIIKEALSGKPYTEPVLRPWEVNK